MIQQEHVTQTHSVQQNLHYAYKLSVTRNFILATFYILKRSTHAVVFALLETTVIF